MTEITKTSLGSAETPPALEQFILHWGDLGGQWGVNRSVAQIHALLYLSDRPLIAEEIAESLKLARSNVSNSIKELLAWKLIRRVPVKGDRRDHFEAEADIWEMVTVIIQGRKERELDPAAEVLRNCVELAADDVRISPTALKRLNEMNEFITTVSTWYEQMQRLPYAKVRALIKMGTKVVTLMTPGKGGAKQQSS